MEETCAKTLMSKRKALAKAIKAVVKNVLVPTVDSSKAGSAPKSSEAESVLRTWRKEGSIWSLIRKRFGSSVPLLLAPHNVYMGGHPHIISGYS